MQQILIIAAFLLLDRWSRNRGWIRVWLFSSMNLSMFVKIASIREGLVTHQTHKGPFSCVFSDMNHQLLRPMKSLVTLGARVLLLPYVSFYMCPQVPPREKVCSHWGQGKVFSPLWILMCLLLCKFRLLDWVKDLSQEEQAKGLSPVCVLLWLFILWVSKSPSSSTGFTAPPSPNSLWSRRIW